MIAARMLIKPCCTLILFCAVANSAATAETPRPNPNVLLISIDDLNDWVGCLGGHPQARTPNIDRLAERGMLFTNAHCQGPICGPSRASLLSGLYPHTTGVYQQPRGDGIEQDAEFFQGHLLPEYFAANGYATLAVGKITHRYSPKRAFQSFGGKFEGSGPKLPGDRRFHFRLPSGPWSGTQTDWGPFPDADSEMSDHRAADWAVEQLARPHDKPFFLAVGFVRPHVPFYVPQKWFDAFPIDQIELPAVRHDDLDDVPVMGRQIHEMPKFPSLAWLQENDGEQFRRCVQAYLACAMFVDHQVGRVLDALDRSAFASDTVIVLFSDHGYHLGEKDRVSKHGLWEESTRVPLIVVPSLDQPLDAYVAGQTCSKPVGLIDIYPTLLELCRLPPKSTNEGRSLTSLMKDPQSDWRSAVLTTYAPGNHSLRSERYRYIRYEDGSEELYDHEDDPHEWTNLAGQPEFASVIARLRDELPAQEAPYHRSTSPAPVNAWFKDHYRRHGVQ